MARSEEKRKPEYVARAREPGSEDRWMTIGAVWSFREGDGYAVRLKSVPVNWDGTFIMVPPLEEDDKK